MGIDLTREPGCLEKEDRFGSTLSVPTRDGKTAPSHLPAQISRSAEYERIFALERKLGNGGNSSALLVTCTVWQAVQHLDRREMNEQRQTGTFVRHSEVPQAGYRHFSRPWAYKRVQPQRRVLLPRSTSHLPSLVRTRHVDYPQPPVALHQ